jgi:hypothetical protein
MSYPVKHSVFSYKKGDWAKVDTIAYLNENHLPEWLTWKNRAGDQVPISPVHQVREYGQWLSETPEFPGLFEAMHEYYVMEYLQYCQNHQTRMAIA